PILRNTGSPRALRIFPAFRMRLKAAGQVNAAFWPPSQLVTWSLPYTGARGWVTDCHHGRALLVDQQWIVVVKRHVVVVDLEDQEGQRGVHDPSAGPGVIVGHRRPAAFLMLQDARSLAAILKRNQHVAEAGVPDVPILAAPVVHHLSAVIQ